MQEDRLSAYISFKDKTKKWLGDTEAQKDKEHAWGLLYRMVEEDDDFTFVSEKLQNSCELIIGAVMLTVKKKKRVIFLTPTVKSGMKASKLVEKLTGSHRLDDFDICPADWFVPEVAKGVDVFVHQGTSYHSTLNNAAPPNARHIIQNFDLTLMK
jgi:hypothetical protein